MTRRTLPGRGQEPANALISLVVVTCVVAIAALGTPSLAVAQSPTTNRPGVGPGAPAAQGTQTNRPGVGPGAAAGAPSIVTQPPGCIPPTGSAPVFATITPATGWSSVRVYFRRAGSTDFYWLEMRAAGNGSYWAVLPKPEEGTTRVEMQVAVRDANGNETRGAVETSNVLESCKPTLTSDQARYAQNLVVGETVLGQRNAAVFGFLCDGIISRIDSGGAIHSDEYCRRAVIAGAVPATAPVTVGKALSPWVPIGIIAGVGGGAAIITNQGPPEKSNPCPCRP